MREVFRRYTEEQVAIAEVARWLTAHGIPTRKGKTVCSFIFVLQTL